jgi:hypothetical protein
VQFEQAEGSVVECSGGGFDCGAGRNYSQRTVSRSFRFSAGSGVGFGAYRRVVGCGYWCQIHRPTGDDHRRCHGEPVDDDD